MVSGVLVNYIEALFIYIFGVNWISYVLHASLINSFISLSTYFLLKEFGLKINYCLVYSLLFATLGYTSSGTPFVDHHSTFFSLLAIYSLLFAIKKENKIFWLSKQVPTFYIFLFISVVIIIYLSVTKKIAPLINIFYGVTFIFVLIFIFGFFGNVDFESFIQQYIIYPQSIGESRFESFNPTFDGLVGHFKFIYISIAPFVFIILSICSGT